MIYWKKIRIFRILWRLILFLANIIFGLIDFFQIYFYSHFYKSKSLKKFLLMKPLGVGFCSDLTVILDCLFFCHISGRIPVTHWGKDSKFGDMSNDDVFEKYFFKKISDFNVTDLQKSNYTYYPIGWNSSNLKNKNTFSFIRRNNDITAFNFKPLLNIQSDVIVIKTYQRLADILNSIKDIKEIIKEDDELSGKCLFEIHRYFTMNYLKPKREVLELIDDFKNKYLNESFLAVHIRGTDKIDEIKNLGLMNAQYKKIIKNVLDKNEFKKIFLLTEDDDIVKEYKKYYGDLIITTNAHRTGKSASQYLYNYSTDKNYILGQEVIIDCYLASNANVFIGNATSAISLVVGMLKDFKPQNLIYLTGKEGILNFDKESYNFFTEYRVENVSYKIIYK